MSHKHGFAGSNPAPAIYGPETLSLNGRADDPSSFSQSALFVIYRVTAYCPNACCCGGFADGVTASGHIIKEGDLFVAAPPSFPFGTMLDISGYGIVPVLDRGSAIQDKKLDVFFPTHQQALDWGVRYIEVAL